MKINLIKATEKDAELIHRMQVESFHEIYLRYRDNETNPVNESVEKILQKLKRPDSHLYLIKFENNFVGGVRIVVKNDHKKFPRCSFCLNIATRESLRQQCPNSKRFLEQKIGNWKQFRRKKSTSICTKNGLSFGRKNHGYKR